MQKAIRFVDQFHFLFGLPVVIYLAYLTCPWKNLKEAGKSSVLIIVSYNVVEQILHKMLHLPCTGPFHRLHMSHHEQDPKKFHLRHHTLDYGLIVYGALGFALFQLLIDNSFVYYCHLIMSVLSFWMHDHYHQPSDQSIFSKYEWFQIRRSHHIVHHHNHKTNLTIAGLFLPVYFLRRFRINT